MKIDRWKNNLGLKVMAVLFAVFLWWTVVNVDDPIDMGKFQVDVLVTNTEVVTNEGKSYRIADGTKAVTVSVRARRKILSDIKASDIIATADFRELQGTSVPVRIKINGFEGKYVEATANPRNLQIQTEITETKTFPITVATIGEVRDGYILDKTNTVAKPKSIEISGPKSSLGRIARVVAKVDVSEMAADATMQAEVIYYDSADNIIDKTLLSSNCDKNGVSVDVKLLVTKQIPVKFDTSLIIPGEGYVFDGIEVEPQTIEVAGKADVLGGITEIAVGAEALKRDGITANEEVVIEMASYLPQGIILADEGAGNIVVRILMEKAGIKTLALPVRSVKVNNASEDFEITYDGEQTVNLQFAGPKDVLQTLTKENISEIIIATIDLSQYKEEGTYDVPVQVIDLPEQCTYLGEATVQITLKKK